jgi:hypothetical protein
VGEDVNVSVSDFAENHLNASLILEEHFFCPLLFKNKGTLIRKLQKIRCEYQPYYSQQNLPIKFVRASN